ncbi:MAG TPA: ATP-binding protein [Candidatus Limnocylindrales bacterium]|nr:ATP-binding protein [Candidatus Limnocylindrales bacterium]
MKTSEVQHSALRIVITLALAIFVAEVTVMAVLAVLPPLGPWVSTFLDATTMVLLVSPLLYWFAFRPLVAMLQERQKSTEALRQANEHLEARVKERTLNLEQANQWLQTEIAERKKGEAELRRAKEEWERTFDAVPDLISIIDDRHQIVRANRAMAERLALTTRQCVGQLCYEAVHGTTCPIETCPHRLTLVDGLEHTAEIHEEHLGGDFLVTTTPLTDDTGKRVGSVHVARDISQQKRDAEALRRARDELELRVQERTADLQTANEQLRRESAVRQQKEAELARASRISMASLLSGSLAHELNQPLGAIVCNVQAAQQYLAQSTPSLGEVRDVLADIEADGKRAGGIIHRLRALYQKTGQQRIALQLNQVIRESTDLMHSEFVFKGVAVELELASELPSVLGNHIELQQVIMNLLINAVDAMATQGAASRRLYVATSCVEPTTVQASIRDSGPGIPAEQLPCLFEPFFTTKITGMGMGLAICRAIIEAHEGRLWVKNNPDCGATFYLALPAYLAHSP